MASVTLLNAVTEDTEGTGQEVTGAVTVYLKGGMGGGFIRIETAETNTPADYRTVHVQRDQLPFVVDAAGTYFVRAVLKDSVSPTLTVTAVN